MINVEYTQVLACPKCGKENEYTVSDSFVGVPVCVVCTIPMRIEYRVPPLALMPRLERGAEVDERRAGSEKSEELVLRCRNCGLEVTTIPKWKDGECPPQLQHEFRAIPRGGVTMVGGNKYDV